MGRKLQNKTYRSALRIIQRSDSFGYERLAWLWRDCDKVAAVQLLISCVSVTSLIELILDFTTFAENDTKREKVAARFGAWSLANDYYWLSNFFGRTAKSTRESARLKKKDTNHITKLLYQKAKRY